MKSFGKTFRAILALSMALCMVMSCVTVSADAVALQQISVATEPDANGYYEVKYEVSGITADGGSATILVYDTEKGGINNDSIAYANQMPVEGNKATFTMLLDNGNYAVLAGGTGFATANETGSVTTGKAPTVTVTPVQANINDKAVANTKVADFTVADVDGIANVETVALSGTGSENFAVVWTKGEAAGTIVVAEDAALTATTYSDLVLTATDAEEKAGASVPFGITVDPSIITLHVNQPAAFTVAYGTTAEDAVKDIKLTTQEGVEVTATWTAPAGYNNGTVTGPHTFTGAVVNPDSNTYEVDNAELSVVITVDTAKVSGFDELYYDADYGKDAKIVAAELLAQYPTVKAYYDGAKEVNVEVTAWAAAEYDGTNAGNSYIFTATYQLPTGFELGADVEAPTVKVTVGQDPTIYIEKITVDSSEIEDFGYGTTEADIIAALAAVKAVGNDDIALTLKDWNCADFVEGEFRNFTFTATAVAPEGDYAFTCGTTVEVEVTVKETRTAISKSDLTASEVMFTVDWGTSLEEVMAKLKTVTARYYYQATLVEPAPVVIDHDAWSDRDNFNGEVAKTYYFDGLAVIAEGFADSYILADDATKNNIVVAVVVEDTRTVIESIKCDTTPIEVPYGTEPTLPGIFLVDEDGNEIPVSDVEWNNGGFSADKPGKYTFTTTVDITDTKEYNFEVAEDSNVISVEVTVGRNQVIVKEGEQEINGDYSLNDDVIYPGGDGVVWVQGTAKATIIGGTYDAGQTKYIDGVSYDQNAVVAIQNAEVTINAGTFTAEGLAEGDSGHIDLIYAADNAKINIKGGTFIGANDTVWLVNIKDDAAAAITISGGLFVGNHPLLCGDAGVVIADGFTVKETTFEGKKAWEVVEKTAVNAIEPVVVYLLDGHSDSYTKTMEDKAESIGNSVKVVVDGAEYTITDIEWPTEGEIEDYSDNFDGMTWPESKDDENPVIVKAKSFTLPDALKLEGDAVPTLKFAVIPDTFNFDVNGLTGNQIITKHGEEININIAYSSKFAGVDVEYYYAITENAVTPTEKDWVSTENGLVTLEELVEEEKVGISRRVSAKVVVEGYELAVKSAYVYRSNSLIDGSIYLSSEGLWSASNENYSAFRVNKNRNLEVKFVLDGKNGADLTVDTNGLACKIDGQEIAGTVKEFNAETGIGYMTIPASAIDALPNGAYKIVFTYTEADAEKPAFEISRTTNITDRTLWYTEMSIDGADRGGVRVGKNLGFEYVLTLDETNPDGNIYAGYKFVEFGEDFGKYDGSIVALNEGNTFTKVFSEADLEAYSGTYSLYGLANLTDNQNFYDFKFARTIYVKNNVTNAYNLFLNGNTAASPSSSNGTLTIKPALGGITLEATRTHTFDITLTYTNGGAPVDLSAEGISIAGGTLDGNNKITGIDLASGVTITGLNTLADKYITAVAEVFVDGDKDAIVTKAFHVKRITVAE